MASLTDSIAPHFFDFHKAVKYHTHTHFWLYGGRGGFKSSSIATELVLLLLTEPTRNAVVLRKVGNTIRKSVYNEVKKAINRLGIAHKFAFPKSALEMTYKPTGQKIVFMGLDDPDKLRSFTFEKGYAAVVWFEELHNFDGMDEVRDALITFMRGGDDFWVFYSFNPPQIAWNWVNKETIARQQRSDTFMSFSTYLDSVASHRHWMGEQFVAEAEALLAENPRAYDWEYMGIVTGTGGAVFGNVEARTITDQEVYTFDRVLNGVDFGWIDPWTMVRSNYDPQSRELVVFDEHTATMTLPEDTGQIIKAALTYPTRPGDKPTYHHEIVWCDETADGKAQVETYKRAGLNARFAAKGNMRKESYRWLAGRRKIVIDPVRTPHTYEEFVLCEYVKDRYGEWIDDFPDGNDHFIDAVRYSLINTIIRSR